MMEHGIGPFARSYKLKSSHRDGIDEETATLIPIGIRCCPCVR